MTQGNLYRVEIWDPLHADAEDETCSWSFDGDMFEANSTEDALSKVARSPGRRIRLTRLDLVYLGEWKPE